MRACWGGYQMDRENSNEEERSQMGRAMSDETGLMCAVHPVPLPFPLSGIPNSNSLSPALSPRAPPHLFTTRSLSLASPPSIPPLPLSSLTL